MASILVEAKKMIFQRNISRKTKGLIDLAIDVIQIERLH